MITGIHCLIRDATGAIAFQSKGTPVPPGCPGTPASSSKASKNSDSRRYWPKVILTFGQHQPRL